MNEQRLSDNILKKNLDYLSGLVGLLKEGTISEDHFLTQVSLLKSQEGLPADANLASQEVLATPPEPGPSNGFETPPQCLEDTDQCTLPSPKFADDGSIFFEGTQAYSPDQKDKDSILADTSHYPQYQPSPGESLTTHPETNSLHDVPFPPSPPGCISSPDRQGRESILAEPSHTPAGASSAAHPPEPPVPSTPLDSAQIVATAAFSASFAAVQSPAEPDNSFMAQNDALSNETTSEFVSGFTGEDRRVMIEQILDQKALGHFGESQRASPNKNVGGGLEDRAAAMQLSRENVHSPASSHSSFNTAREQHRHEPQFDVEIHSEDFLSGNDFFSNTAYHETEEGADVGRGRMDSWSNKEKPSPARTSYYPPNDFDGWDAVIPGEEVESVGGASSPNDSCSTLSSSLLNSSLLNHNDAVEDNLRLYPTNRGAPPQLTSQKRRGNKSPRRKINGAMAVDPPPSPFSQKEKTAFMYESMEDRVRRAKIQPRSMRSHPRERSQSLQLGSSPGRQRSSAHGSTRTGTKSVSKVHENFIQRQAYNQAKAEENRKRQTDRHTPKFKPSICKQSEAIMRSSNGGGFEERQRLRVAAENSARALREAEQAQSERTSFKPQINQNSQRRRRRSVNEMSTRDAQARQAWIQAAQERKIEEEVSHIQQPKLTERGQRSRGSGAVMPSLKSSGHYDTNVTFLQNEKFEMLARQKQEAENLKLKACTFRPATKKCPSYVKQMATLTRKIRLKQEEKSPTLKEKPKPSFRF